MHARRLDRSRVFTARNCGALTVLHYLILCYVTLFFFHFYDYSFDMFELKKREHMRKDVSQRQSLV